MSKALFVGRFQPFHIGHIDAIKQIAADSDVEKIIIGIGSSQYSETEDNPYTFEKRKKMIERALKDEITKQYEIIAIPDIHDENNWVTHVENIVGKFDVIYTGNDWLKKLFEEKNYQVKPVSINIDISATELRELIKNKNDEWKKFIPECNQKLIPCSSSLQA